MDTPSEIAAFDRAVRPLMQIVLSDKAEAVISFGADPELQERINELAELSAEGQLTESRKIRVCRLCKADKFVAILKQHAHRFIDSQPEP